MLIRLPLIPELGRQNANEIFALEKKKRKRGSYLFRNRYRLVFRRLNWVLVRFEDCLDFAC